MLHSHSFEFEISKKKEVGNKLWSGWVP